MAKKKFGNTRVLTSQRVQARYYLPSGEQVTAGTFDTEEAAQQRLDEIEIDLRRGDHWDDRKGRKKFSYFMEEYMESRKQEVRPTEYGNNRSYLKVHLLPVFGVVRMRDIDEQMVDAWFVSMPRTETRRNVYTFLRRAMKFAIKWGYIRVSPCNVLTATKVERPRPNWTVDDFRSVLGFVPEKVRLNNSMEPTPTYYREALEILFAAHLRVGELVGLNASDFDRRTRMLTVARQVNRLGMTTETKTGVIKTITLLDVGIAATERLPSRIGAVALVPGPRSERMPRQSLQRAWRRAVEDAGYENFHVHDIRHIGLSLLVEAETPMKDVMVRGGHSSLASAMRYQHTNVQRDREAAERVNRLLG